MPLSLSTDLKITGTKQQIFFERTSNTVERGDWRQHSTDLLHRQQQEQSICAAMTLQLTTFNNRELLQLVFTEAN